MTQVTKKETAIARAQSALRRKRRNLVIATAVVVLLAIALGVVLYLTSRTAFIDPTDGSKYYIVKVKKEKEEILSETDTKHKYVMEDEDGELLPRTEEGNYVTRAGTIVYVDAKTGAYSTVAAVLVEDGETVKFNYSSYAYDVLLYPRLERKDIETITVHNEKDSFTVKRVDMDKENYSFYLDSRPDFTIDRSIMLTTLIQCAGNTRTLLRLDTERVKEIVAKNPDGYRGEYGLPNEGEEATCYFTITATDAAGGKTHKVIIGNEIPSGQGYYARYEGRDAIYVLTNLTATEFNGSFADALFGTEEDYVDPVGASWEMTTSNYFDVTDFYIRKQGEAKPLVAFSYTGSIAARQNTYYESIPYVALDYLKEYGVNSFRIDDCLYQLYSWAPTRVVKLLSGEAGDYNEALREFNLDAGSYLYEITFDLHKSRAYKNGEEIDPRDTWERHRILISEKDGHYYMFNMGYNYNPENGEFDKMADGYLMVVEMEEKQLDFLFWTLGDWTATELFAGNIAYLSELSVKIKGGEGNYKDDFRKTFYLDNSKTLEKLAETVPSNPMISSSELVVRDDKGSMDINQFRLFYGMLLNTNLIDRSALTEAEKEQHRASGTEGAALVIKVKYVLLKYDAETNTYVETKEVIERELCFYRSYGTRQVYVTVNGVGEFCILRSRLEKMISDVDKLYHPETPITYH